jgi:hypothetical protein
MLTIEANLMGGKELICFFLHNKEKKKCKESTSMMFPGWKLLMTKEQKRRKRKKKKNKQINKSTLTVMLSSRLTLDYKLHEQLCPVWCAGQSWA